MSESEKLTLVLVVLFTTCLFVMGVFFFVLINRYRRNLEKRKNEALNNLIVGQDNERERISRDLHDELGPEMATIILTLDGIKSTDQAVIEVVNKSKADLKTAIKSVRNISHDLMSLSLLKYGLSDALHEMIDRQANDKVEVKYTSNCAGTEFNDAIKSHLFKITQELLYNTKKHSNATKVQIHLNLNQESRELQFTYSDNGVGDQGNKNNQGIGIKNIHTRVGLMNGSIRMDTQNGYLVAITVKLG